MNEKYKEVCGECRDTFVKEMESHLDANPVFQRLGGIEEGIKKCSDLVWQKLGQIELTDKRSATEKLAYMEMAVALSDLLHQALKAKWESVRPERGDEDDGKI